MPDSPFPMTLPGGAMLIGEPCMGDLSTQRVALAGLMARSGWPETAKNALGQPVLPTGYCSLSHGGGWVAAARGEVPIGIDVEAAGMRLEKARRRFAGPADQPVLDQFGDSLDTLCRLWTAKEAVFKVFGTGVDFLTGLEWLEIHDTMARIKAVDRDVDLDLLWYHLRGPKAWMAVATIRP